jgi:sulfur-carrier protein adenylyltransferase/sulfurtransferase
MIDEVIPQELKGRLDQGRAVVLLDVRQGWETQLCALAHATHIPMEEIEVRVDELDPELATVVYCHLGVRSAAVVDYLRQWGFRDVKNLAGGLDAWARTVDPSMRRY